MLKNDYCFDSVFNINKINNTALNVYDVYDPDTLH